MKKERPRSLMFQKAAYAWKADVDYRREPQRYRVGKGEQGVLICEPYKSELVPHWRFKTRELAKVSSKTIARMFKAYLDADDFAGADMARKFLQMGYTRARRYANYRSGKKYDAQGTLNERGTGDPAKAESARIFYDQWKRAEANPRYARRKAEWKVRYG